MKNRKNGQSRSIASAVFEALEARQMLTTDVTATAASLAAPASYSWGTYETMTGMDKLVAAYPKLTGSGESIAVIDSGVDYDNPALGGGFGSGYKVEGGYDFESNDSNPFSSTDAHGTAVAGIAAATPYYVNGVRYQGVAPGVNLLALREDTGSQCAEALSWVIANKTKYNIVAVNMTDWTGPVSDYISEVNTLTSMGVFISVPAGNGGAGTKVGPNTLNNLYSIGGTTLNGGLWSGSSRGSNTPLVAPADDVMIPYYQTNDGRQVYYDGGSGTSWSAPWAAGTAALLKEIDPNWTPAQLMSIMQQSANHVYDSASNYTYDSLDVYNAVKLAYSLVGQTPAPAATPTPAPATTTTPTGTSTPFSTVTIASSGTSTIQAENFDNGGQGVAYHTGLTSNPGGQDRSGDVGIEKTADSGGGYDVGWVEAGDWFNYTVNFAATGKYTFSARVAQYEKGGTFHVDVDGTAVTGELTIPSTGGPEDWQTISVGGISIGAGKHVIRIVTDSNGVRGTAGGVGNFNWFQFTPTSIATAAAAAVHATTTTSTPYQGIPDASMVQAENYDLGGQGVGYHTTLTSNPGGQYRNDDVGIEKTSDTGGGYDVGWLTAGDWLQYTVNFSQTKTYTFGARVAYPVGGGTFHVEIDGVKVGGELTIPKTGGIEDFTGIFEQVAVTAGVHKVRLVMDSNGPDGIANINWFRFV